MNHFLLGAGISLVSMYGPVVACGVLHDHNIPFTQHFLATIGILLIVASQL